MLLTLATNSCGMTFFTLLTRVMKMFLEGKKFPQGTLSAFKWRIYVYDIVRFATNEKFMNWFLEFDPDTFFKLMKQLFTE